MKTSKKIAIIFSTLFLSQLTFAQISNPQLYIGGESNLNFSTKTNGVSSTDQSIDQFKTISFNFTPKFGLFTTNELLLGAAVPIQYNQRKSVENNDKIENTAILLSPFIQYYFSNKNIRPFINVSVGAGSITSKSSTDYSGSSKQTNGLFKASGGLGIAFFTSKHLSLDLLLQYEYLGQNPEGDNPNNVHYFSKGFDFRFGISGYL